MTNWLYALVSMGINAKLSSHEVKSVLLTNAVILLIALCWLFFSVTFFFLDIEILGFCTLSFFVISFLWLLANEFGYYRFAKFGFLISTNIMGLIICWILGDSAHFYTGYFAIVGIPILLLGTTPQDKNFVIPFSMVSILCYFLLRFLFGYSMNPPKISEGSVMIIRLVIEMATFVVIFFNVYYLFRLNQISDTKNQN